MTGSTAGMSSVPVHRMPAGRPNWRNPEFALLEDAIEQLKTRQQKLRDEQVLLDGQLDRSELEQLREEQEPLDPKRKKPRSVFSNCRIRCIRADQALREAEQSSSEYRQTVQSLKATMESQQALLDEQMGAGDDAAQSWLADQGLTDAPRLAAKLSIEDGWEFAVEQVIGRFTQGLTLPEFDQLATALESAPSGFAVVSDRAVASETRGLAAKVSGVGAISQLLSSVQAADTLSEAMANRSGLAPGESIITRDGVWLSRDWLLMPDSDAAQVGVIERQKKVTELQAKRWRKQKPGWSRQPSSLSISRRRRSVPKPNGTRLKPATATLSGSLGLWPPVPVV